MKVVCTYAGCDYQAHRTQYGISWELRLYKAGYPPDVVMISVVPILAVQSLSVAPVSPDIVVLLVTTVW